MTTYKLVSVDYRGNEERREYRSVEHAMGAFRTLSRHVGRGLDEVTLWQDGDSFVRIASCQDDSGDDPRVDPRNEPESPGWGYGEDGPFKY